MSIIGLGNQVLVCRPSLQKLSNQKAIMINVWEELLLTFNFFCTILEDTADCEKVSSLIPRQGGLLQDINFSSEINYKCIRQPHKNDLKSKKKIFKDFCMQAIWNCQNQGFALYISLAICNCHNVFIQVPTTYLLLGL